MRLQVIFLELDVGDDRRKGIHVRVLPDAVSTGIAERALRGAVTQIEEEDLALLRRSNRKPNKDERRRLEKVMVPVAMQVLEGLLVEEGVRTAVLASRQTIEIAVRKLVRTATIPEHGEGRRIFSARERASKGTLSYVRDVGNQALFVGELGQNEYASISAKWEASWPNANREWKKLNSVNVWRCGGALFAIGDQNLEGISVR